jgi:hypothetical protein
VAASDGPGIVTVRDDSPYIGAISHEIANDFSGRSGDRTCDFVRVNGAEGDSSSMIAPPCTSQDSVTIDRDPTCFTVRQDDSSRKVTENRAERNGPDSVPLLEIHPQVATAVDTRNVAPTTSGEAPGYQARCRRRRVRASDCAAAGGEEHDAEARVVGARGSERTPFSGLVSRAI